MRYRITGKLGACLFASALMAAVVWTAFAGAADVRPVNKACTVVDCGTPLRELKLQASTLYKHPTTGKLHLFLEYGANNGYGIGEHFYGERGDVRHYLIDVELESGKMRSARGGNGHESTSHFLHPNGKMYLFEIKTYPSNLSSFDTRTGKYEFITATGNSTYKTCLAPSGIIYSGEVSGDVTVYNPETNQITRFHHPAGRNIHWGVYTMEVEEPYIYCGMTNQGNWFLTIIDTRTGKATSYFDVERGQPKVGGGITRTADGNIFFNRYLLKDGKPQFETDAQGNPILDKNGVPKALPLPQPDKSERLAGNRPWPNMRRLSGYASSRYKEEEALGLDFDLSQAEPNNFNDNVATVLWRKKGEKDWRNIVVKGMKPEGRSPKALAAMPDGRFFGVSGYGMAFVFDPKTGKSVEVGDPPGSVYQIMPFKDKLYFCGYVSFLAEYDLAQPYAFNKLKGQGSNDWSQDTNPKRYRTNAKWSATMIAGPDGLIYIGGYDGRHNTGGGLSIFNPETKEMQALRDPWFKYLGIKGLALVNDGRTLAITTAPVGQRDKMPKDLDRGSIFLYDFAEKKIVKEVKLNFKASPDQMFVAGDGTVIGISRVKKVDSFDNATNTTLVYGLDLQSGKTLFEKEHPGRAFNGMLFADRPPIVQGPDGCGWLFVDNDLCRILPNGEIEHVRAMPETRGQMFFVGETLYVYNGGRIFYRTFPNVVKIEDLFAGK